MAEKKTYQGKSVNLIRDARAGDANFVANTDQVVIQVDGEQSQKTVKRNELT